MLGGSEAGVVLAGRREERDEEERDEEERDEEERDEEETKLTQKSPQEEKRSASFAARVKSGSEKLMKLFCQLCASTLPRYSDAHAPCVLSPVFTVLRLCDRGCW